MAGSVQPRQLAFALPHAESLTRDNFLEGPANGAALGSPNSALITINGSGTSTPGSLKMSAATYSAIQSAGRTAPGVVGSP